jgi:putative (di)nucleoside polyphosphate hydrolase
MNKEWLPYRPGVGALVFNRRGQVLVARRRDIASEAWQLPQGGVDTGEDIRDAVLREVTEELGTGRLEVLTESHDWHTYDLPDELVGKAFKGRYRGQRQRWYALLFTGSDEEIDCAAVENPEFSEWKWATIEELPGMAVSFKRRVYEALVKEFKPLAERLAAQGE